MFSATHKMSLEESDVPTDEDCEELVSLLHQKAQLLSVHF